MYWAPKLEIFIMDDKEIFQKAKLWLSDFYDPSTRKKVKKLIEEDSDELIDAFQKKIEFGRSILGVGPHRINRYTLGMISLSLARYLKKFLML